MRFSLRPVARVGTTGIAALVLLAGFTPEGAAQSVETLESPYVWAGAGAVLAGTILLDPWLRHQLRADGVENRASLTHLGNALGNGERVLLGLGSSYLVARIAGQERLSDPLGRMLAGLVTAGVVNGSLKWSIGRQRPDVLDEEHLDFRPFNMEDGWQSFPSGHVVTAFAVATALSIEADRPWVTGSAYGLAGVVAWSRLHEERHWASDAVAGAVSGSAASALMVHWLRSRRESTSDLQIIVEPGMMGLSIPSR